MIEVTSEQSRSQFYIHSALLALLLLLRVLLLLFSLFFVT